MFTNLKNGLDAVYIPANKTDKILKTRVTFYTARTVIPKLFWHQGLVSMGEGYALGGGGQVSFTSGPVRNGL